jgi:two-component system sensor histidine kinase/response regulator
VTKKPNVLIIDDDKIMLDSCTQVFVKEGYQTQTAENGDKGLKKFKDETPDLVLVDLKMPGIDGMEVLKELKTTDPNCVAIVITGYGTIESAVEAMKRGAYDFLLKPFTPDELRIIVRRGLERKKCIEQTKMLKEEKEKMRENFVSMVSHELRSPLAAVQQNLMVILAGMVGEIPEKTQQMLLRMKERIRGLISLISDWLDLSRIESGEMVSTLEPVELGDVLRGVVDLLQPLADEKKVTLSFTESAEYSTILGNRETLQMLFTNLVHNGIKYNREGGKVGITSNCGDSVLIVTIEDTGIGIPHENLPLIFEQFYRVKNGKQIGGSGLGLSIAKKIVEVHSGSIEVESEQGKGTVFKVRLPMRNRRQ